MNREKVEFPANIPTVVELDGIGTLQCSKSGDDEYRYFLRDNRIMWVPPAVHEQIAAAEGNTGDAFQITKHQAKARAPIQWEAQLIEQRPGTGYSNQPPAAAPAPRPQRDLRAAAYARDAREASHHQPTSQAPHQAGAREYQPPQPAAQLAADAREYATGPADRMAQALKDAIDLTRGAKQYAPELAWSTADVRAIAATLFIEGAKGGRA